MLKEFENMYNLQKPYQEIVSICKFIEAKPHPTFRKWGEIYSDIEKTELKKILVNLEKIQNDGNLNLPKLDAYQLTLSDYIHNPKQRPVLVDFLQDLRLFLETNKDIFEDPISLKKEKENIVFRYMERWKEMANKIENNPMPNSEISELKHRFYEERVEIITSETYLRNAINNLSPGWKEHFDNYKDKLNEIETRFITACSISVSNWNALHPNIVERILINLSKIKLPDVSILPKPD